MEGTREVETDFWKKHKSCGFGFSYQGNDYDIFNGNVIVVRNTDSGNIYDNDKLCKTRIVPFFSEEIEGSVKANLMAEN